MGEIHTHVAESRVGEADERSSQLSIKDLFWANKEGHDFTCVIRKGKMTCADLTKLNQPGYQRTPKENKVASDLFDSWSDESSYEKGNQAPPMSWFKTAEAIKKAIPQYEISI